MTNKELGEFVSQLVRSSLTTESACQMLSAALVRDIPKDSTREKAYVQMLVNAVETSVSLSTQMVLQALSKWHYLDLDSIAYSPEPGPEQPYIVILDSRRHENHPTD